MAGGTGLRAPHGARDVTLAMSDTIAGRAFSAADFVTSHAPRAAVYEALPGFMLRLENRGAAGERLRNSGSPAWVRLSVGERSYEPDYSRVGAAYDIGRFEAEAGVEFTLLRQANVTGWASLRHVRGSADVSAPTGGGKIEATGIGPSLGLSWENAAGYFGNGRISVTRYETDLRADGRGLLKEGVGATIRALAVEAGRRFSLSDDLSLMPQAWLTLSDVSMDGFRDAVGTRVSSERRNAPSPVSASSRKPRIRGTAAKGSLCCAAVWAWKGCWETRRRWRRSRATTSTRKLPGPGACWV